MREAYVFDTGPLSHFAEAGWLKILQVVTGDRLALIPELVYDELSGAGRVTSSTRPYSLASVTSSHRPV